jgi:carbon-monoxide dehydrogenase large subunit
MRTVEMIVNGSRLRREVSTRQTLGDFLREELRLTGTHLGCEHGVCGVCTVQVDGEAVRSCLMLAVQADGHDVCTIEGLASPGGELDALQQAFSARHALQCGFCTPGVLMSLDEHLRDPGEVSEGSVRCALSGNLCRCTGYAPMVQAALDVARDEPAPAPPDLASGEPYVGRRVRRHEDPRLLTGQGQFVADYQVPGMVYASFVRAPLAHARILSIDVEAASLAPGVVAILSASDLPESARGAMTQHMPNAALRHGLTQPLLAVDEVCYVGQTVAVVVAEDPYLAEDAAELVDVDYEELGPVSGIAAARRADAVVHVDLDDNVAATWTVSYGDVDRSFEEAAHVTRASFEMNRGAGQPMECRGVLAVPDAHADRLTVYTATQAPHLVKRTILEMVDIESDRLTVVAPPDVGGGFGPKVIVYPEDVVVPLAAQLLGLPVRWLEDRREHFISTTHERAQEWDVEMALDADGRVLGLRGAMRHDGGAFMPWGIVMPYISSTTTPGPYRLPGYRLDVEVLFTNAVPTTPVRGAGRPQAVFVMERLLDFAATELGLDRAEIRRRNLIPEAAMPYEVGLVFRDGRPVVYDSGDYPATLEAGLAAIDHAGFEKRRAAAAIRGRHRGLGMALYVEGTGLGPFEGTSVRVERDGTVTVHTAAAPQGQSHQTTIAQVVADQLGVPWESVRVRTGDTSTAPIGVGTFASRVMVVAGSSAHRSAREVRRQALEVASGILEADADDLDIVAGVIGVRGAGDTATVTLAEVARTATGVPGMSNAGRPTGLFANESFTPEQATYAHGAHFAEVEVDVDTGAVHIEQYVVVHDCGTVVNPMVVDGQIQGGVAHGIGNAFLEACLYDENGQPTTTTYLDYLMPEASDVPTVRLVHLESPTPLNPLGAKGAGEGGTIPAAAALVGAVDDALRDYGARTVSHPMTPRAVRAIVASAGSV